MIKLGREEPVASMDNNGKIIYAKHNEVQSVNVKSLSDSELIDGERLPLAIKDMGSSDIYPQVRSPFCDRIKRFGSIADAECGQTCCPNICAPCRSDFCPADTQAFS